MTHREMCDAGTEIGSDVGWMTNSANGPSNQVRRSTTHGCGGDKALANWRSSERGETNSADRQEDLGPRFVAETQSTVKHWSSDSARTEGGVHRRGISSPQAIVRW